LPSEPALKTRLYNFKYCPLGARVGKLLHYKGIEFETIEVDYLERKELLAVSNQVQTPVLATPHGAAIVDVKRITNYLEEHFPNPTVLPDDLRGAHLALTDHIDGVVNEALMRAAVADIADFWRRRGADRVAFWKHIKDRRYGDGFCDRMIRERDANLAAAWEALAPFEAALRGKAFLLGRIGLADFALYGQMRLLAFTGEIKLPGNMPGLHAFFGRMDCISSFPEMTG
jgi:glutathione S-transferase